LSEWLVNLLARTARFHIITRDDEVINAEGKIERLADRRVAIAETLRRRRLTMPDFVLRIDATKTAEYVYRGNYGDARYILHLTSGFLDHHTGEILSSPSIPESRISSEPQKYISVNGRYYTGFDYTNPGNIERIYHDLAEQAFKISVNALLQSIPSTGRVLAIKDGRFTLDRGAEAGVFPGETMILFREHSGLLEPLAVSTVQPGRGRSAGIIVRWKKSPAADDTRLKSTGVAFNAENQRIFAASVGMPEGYRY
jgi:hypothetical protein